MTTDRPGTKEQLVALAGTFDTLVDKERAILDRLRPDLVVANVSYIALAASQAAGIPNLALCCMNWADVFAAMDLGAACSDVIGRMRQTYGAADLFLKPAPHMTMADLPNSRSIGPIARRGRARRTELVRLLGCTIGTRLVLYSLGGVAVPAGTVMPEIKDTCWMVTDESLATRPDVIPVARLGWAFEDLVASVDAVVGKDSYGTVAEAACAGVPLVMMTRDNWPETPCLVEWAERNCAFALAGQSSTGLVEALDKLSTLPRRHAIQPSGIDDAVDTMLAGTRS